MKTFFQKNLQFGVFDLEIVKKLPKLWFLAIFWTLHLQFSLVLHIMIGGHDVQLFSYTIRPSSQFFFCITFFSSMCHHMGHKNQCNNITGYCTSFYVCCRNKISCKHSIINLLRKRYGKILVEDVRKFEKYDFKYKKAIHDLDFLLICKEKNIPKFLRFKLANRQLQFSNTNNICLSF